MEEISGSQYGYKHWRIFQTLKDIKPNAKTVSAFYATNDGEYSAGEGEYTDLKYKLIYNRKKLADKKEFKSALEELKGKTDAFLWSTILLFKRRV